jgi:hypothetical protein
MSITDDDQFAAYGGANYDYLATEEARIASRTGQADNVRFWHEADMSWRTRDARFRGHSGHGLMTASSLLLRGPTARRSVPELSARSSV